MRLIIFIHFFYMSLLAFVDLGNGANVLSRFSAGDRRDVLPPLVPPKLVDEDDDFEERDLTDPRLRPSSNHLLHLAGSSSPYWAPTLDNLSPGDEEFYRKALVNAIAAGQETSRHARSMGMLRMGRGWGSAEGQGIKRSMTMLRMGRAFDDSDEEEQEKRSMGMLRMGRGLDGAEEAAKRTMGMLRMGRAAAAAGRNVDRGALNMLRMGKRAAAAAAEAAADAETDAEAGRANDKS